MTTDIELQRAVEHHRAERFSEAEQLYRSILLAEPDHPDANHNFGLLALQMGLFEDGLPFFRAAVSAAPERRQFWSSYIEALTLNGRHDEAREVCESGRRRGFALQATDAAKAAPTAEAAPADERELLANEFAETIATLVQQGLFEQAETLARQMTDTFPARGDGWKFQAHAALQRGDLAAALAPLEKVVALMPEDAQSSQHLYAAQAMRDALALDSRGDYAEAGKLYQAVLETFPDHPGASHKLGVIAIRLHQPEAAIPLLEKAIGANPNELQYWAHYIDALFQAGQLKAAWLALEMAQQRGLAGPAIDQLIAIMTKVSSQPTVKVPRPVFADAQGGLPVQPVAAPRPVEKAPPRPARPLTATEEKQCKAIADLFNRGKVQEAIDGARELVERLPSHGFGWKVIGVSLHRLGRYDEALEYIEKALEFWPEDIDLLILAAGVLQMKNRLREAHVYCSRLLQLQPDHAEGLRVMGVILMGQGQLKEAEEIGLRAIEAAPNAAMPVNSLGVTLMKQGRLDEAAELFARGARLAPENDMMYSNRAFCVTHSENVTPAEVFAAHRSFAEQFEAPLKAHWPTHANDKDPERRLRVGFVSGDFCHHAVASFFEPMLVALLRDASLSVYGYSSTPVNDDVTARLRSLFSSNWRDVVGMKDGALADMIATDGIDILIDLSGHTALNRLRTFAYKPAPLQASWIGYPGTTGLDAVDYFIADRFWVPSEQFRDQFTEKIAYLPALAPFEADRLCPPVNGLPALRNGYVTFGSFNRLDKLRRDVIALWARVLREVPDARLFIGAMPRDGNGDLAEWFAEEGIASERIEFRARSSVAVYLQQHHHVDICLDSFPFSGLTTALHSLWMGVPTLTLPAHTVPGRSGLTAMSHVGLEQYIATDKDDYVSKAVALAADIPALTALRAGLRERCSQSPMFRPDVVAASMSRALRVMWRRWCEGAPAESFEVS
ncbi:tetratricopeptide repeat protein [Paraburkholderia sp.]|uniref:tetratricopeptide repeat protein n=1 Tax=Paraburkholderia sp. TaxID=1926495 RepID=UPI0039E65F5C